MKVGTRAVPAVASIALLASCAAVLGLPDPTLDDAIPIGGGSSSGNASSSGSSSGVPDGAPDDASTDGPVLDATDGGLIACNAQTPWGNITRLDVSSPENDFHASLTDDELIIVWTAQQPGNPNGAPSGFTSSRDAATEPFRPRSLLTDSPGVSVIAPCVGPRGDEGFFAAPPIFPNIARGFRTEAGTYTVSPNAAQTGLETQYDVEACGMLLADAGVMYLYGETPFSSQGGLFRAARVGTNAWDGAVPLAWAPDAETPTDRAPVVRADELEMFFARREGNDYQIFTSRRPNTNAPWSPATKVVELSAVGFDAPSWLSPDGCRLYFAGSRGDAGVDLYVATRPRQ